MEEQFRPSIIKRLLALIIDFIILGIIGYVSGFFLEDFYVSLGIYGTLFGTVIAIIYFSIFQSSIGKGQTPGKKFMRAKVTDLKGEYLTLEKSFLRSSILFFPFLNTSLFAGRYETIIILLILSLINLITHYFILVNKSRRCLHDILISSVVTYQNVTEIDIDPQNDRSIKKIVPIGIIAAFLFIVSTFVIDTTIKDALKNMYSIKEKIENIDGVITVSGIKENTSTHYSLGESSETNTTIQVELKINDKEEIKNTDSQYFYDIYDIIKREIPEYTDMDAVIITLYYGYDIGIAKKNESVTKVFE